MQSQQGYDVKQGLKQLLHDAEAIERLRASFHQTQQDLWVELSGQPDGTMVLEGRFEVRIRHHCLQFRDLADRQPSWLTLPLPILTRWTGRGAERTPEFQEAASYWDSIDAHLCASDQGDALRGETAGEPEPVAVAELAEYEVSVDRMARELPGLLGLEPESVRD